MRKQSLMAILTTVLTLFAAAARADYSNTVVSLHPVAYWPLNETVQPPQAYVATNSGTLGSLGNGYYEAWLNPSGNGYTNQMDWTGPVPGATSDGDGAASFTGDGNRYIQIPHTVTNTVIQAPFSVECWTYATNASDWENLVGAGGQYNRPSDANGDQSGFNLVFYNGNWHFDLYNGSSANNTLELSTSATTGQWAHLVATFDGTNATLYLNGTEVAVGIASTNSSGLGYVADAVNPIIIGRLNPEKYSNAYQGLIDEVAIYTNVLAPTDVANHYYAATAGGYPAAVKANNPLIYLRLDEPLYNLPASNTFSSYPQAVNYGSIGGGANGYYQPGTVPGLPGPTGSGFGAANYAVGINGQNAAVDVGNGNLMGVAPALNVTGTNALTVSAWYKGPADGYNRFQGILGHGDSGWRFGFGGSGPQFNPGGGGEIASSDTFNDNRWHMAVGVYDGSTNYIYIDGKLITSTPYSGSQTGNGLDVILGGAPDYTTPTGRYWNGSLAQVSFFTNALTAGNILQLYTAAGITPFITQQPVSAAINAGAAFTNSVSVSGSPILSYQWYQNGSPVSGQTNLNLVYNPVSGVNAGSYYFVASNAGGSVTSSVVTLSVYTSPQISQQPLTNYVLFAGGSATFNLTASGALPIYYYWSSNGVVVSSTTSSSYTLANVSRNASFTCLVSNSLGSVTSSSISVSVIAAPTNAYPQAVLASGPIAYWRLDEPDNGLGNYNAGVVAHDFWGGHNGVYTNTELGQAGYPVTPADPDTAALFGDVVNNDSDVSQIPGINFGTNGNAEFSIEAWVNAPASQTVSGGGIITKGTGGGGEQFNLDTGSGSFAFRFFVRNAAGGAYLANSTVVPDGNWHHLVGVCDEANGKIYLYIDGALAASSTIPVGSGILNSSNPVSIGARQSGTGDYDDQFYGTIDEVAIYNYALTAAQEAAHYNTTASGPPVLKLDIQPLYTKAFAGMPFNFAVSVTGMTPLQYQWYQSGSPVGLNTNTYAGSILPGTNTYYCIVSNADGSVSSSTATIVGVAITDSGGNSGTNATTFAINFVDAANAAYSPDNGTTYYNIAYQGLGAYADNPANTNWNGFGLPNGFTPTFNSAVAPQVASDGTQTPVTLSLIYEADSSPIYFGPGISGNATQGQPSVLFGATAVVNASGPGIGTSGNPLGGITLSNVPEGTYTLYLYGAGPGNDRGAVFNFTSGTALGGTNTALNADNGSPASNIVYGVTYVIYTNVSPDTNGTITGTWGAVSNPISNNSGEGDFNGLQLVRVSGATVVTKPVLTIHLSAAHAIVSWNPSNGTLQSATSVTGPYTDITGVTSPYTNTISGTQQFFRVRQ